MSIYNCLIKSSQVILPDNITGQMQVEKSVNSYLNDRNLDPSNQKIGAYTQRLSGLVASLNTDFGNQFWYLSEGTAKIVDAYEDPENPEVHPLDLPDQVWDKPSQLNGSTVTAVYAYFYWDGSDFSMGYQEAAPIADDLADKLFLCAIISANGTTIDEVRPISLADEPYTKFLLDYGAVNVDNVYPQPIPLTMRLSFPGGRFKFAGRNAYNNPKQPHTLTYDAIALISYDLCDPDGNVLSQETDLNFNRYWDGSQIVQLSDPNFASAQFLYLFPSGAFAVVLGTNEYAGLNLAADGWTSREKDRLPVKFRNNSYFLGAIAGIGTATDIADHLKVIINN